MQVCHLFTSPQTPGPNETRSKIIWYTCGQMVNSAILGPELGESATAQIRNYIPNLVPTSSRRLTKHRTNISKRSSKSPRASETCSEICASCAWWSCWISQKIERSISSLTLSSNCSHLSTVRSRSWALRSCEATQCLLYVASPAGTALVYPTADLPPNTFGTWDKLGYLDNETLVWDPQTQEPQQGMVLLAYFTKVALDDPGNFKGKRMQLDINSPFN